MWDAARLLGWLGLSTLSCERPFGRGRESELPLRRQLPFLSCLSEATDVCRLCYVPTVYEGSHGAGLGFTDRKLTPLRTVSFVASLHRH